MSQPAAVGTSPRISPFPATRLSIQLQRLVGLVALFGLMAAAALAYYRWQKTPLRVGNDTARLPWSMPSETPWSTENAYPQLKFFEPTCVQFAIDGSGRVFVLERRGSIQMFTDSPDSAQSVKILDISESVWRTPYEDDGAVGLVLHPEFGDADSPNGKYLYMLYTAKVGETRYNRLSRFTVDGETAGEELILIDQLNENLWHNGGGLAFGPDGFLYVGIGDEGTNGDGLQNGQRINRDLYCGILRLDVDCRGGDVSHEIVKQPETGKTQGYYIPNDNPFVGQPGVLEEFWAHGLRNPFRIAFDPANGRLWAADVGHLRREEVNLIVRGGNYGWSYREGSLSFDESYLKGVRPADVPGEHIDPVWEYPHLNGNTCVIGGFVYRSYKYPSLEGKFIYADNGSGRVWALSYDEQSGASNEELVALPVSSKTGIASVQPDASGQPMLVILGESNTTDGTLVRLVPAKHDTAAVFPTRLSETGIFSDIASLTTQPGFIQYEVRSPQSIGVARERNWVSIPGDGNDPDPSVDRIQWRADGAWKFPVGSTFVQHFELPVNDQGEVRWQRIETRVLVRYQGQGVYGLSYRWNEDGTDAELVQRGEQVAFQVEDMETPGQSRTQHWQFFDRQACLSCHNPNAGFVLGWSLEQLNGAKWNDREGTNVLTQLDRRGYLHEAIGESLLTQTEALVNPQDEQQTLDRRARSYLATNCSSCHREGGARANFYALYHETAKLEALSVKPLQADFGLRDALLVAPGNPHQSVLYYRLAKLGQGRMPFLGAHDLDHESLELVHDWIAQMPTPVATDSCHEIVEQLASAASPEVRQTLIRQSLVDTTSAFALWQAVIDESLEAEVRQQIVDLALAEGTPATRDLFEWFVEAENRTQRLGTEFDPQSVLQLAGDSARGELLFRDTQVTTCANCHSTTHEQVSLGPSLADIGLRMDRVQTLQHIMQPSLQIAESYKMITVVLIDGSSVQGIPVPSDDATLVIRDVRGESIEVLRDDIEEMVESPVSLMPEHLLQAMTPQQAADLLEYLNSLRIENPASTAQPF